VKRIALALVLNASTTVLAQHCAAPADNAATIQPVDRSEVFPERRQQIQASLALQSYAVLTLGDSIMQLWSDERLDGIFGTKVLNSGFGRDGTEHVLWRLQSTDWHGESPRQVLLLVGTNDIGASSCDIYWGIRAVVSKVHGLFPSARVVVTGILPRGENMLQSDDKIRATNLELKAAAPAGNFAFFDPHDAFLCHHQTPCTLFVPENNLHLTAAGYDLLDELLKKFLAQDKH
jgi:platelet-activating factor acetylhydrolase IB subunit beta/gamma